MIEIWRSSITQRTPNITQNLIKRGMARKNFHVACSFKNTWLLGGYLKS
jgi:hypothetical protein